jgi:hypothetical protein
VAGLTRAELAAALAASGAAPGAVEATTAALDACDAARFGGGAAPHEDLSALAAGAVALLDAPRPGGRP